MSMLAEPRRKQRISVDPQNKFWKEDESKFGKKLMEKMGWKSGQGLGAGEQGIREHVKLKQNLNQRGLGDAHNPDDNWLAHQDDFSAILASLNKANPKAESSKERPQSDGDAGSTDQKSSLADISSTCRARINYHKFTRGKDLRQQKAEDVACVLGRKRRRRKSSTKEEPVAQPEPTPPADVPADETSGKKKKKKKKRSKDIESESEVQSPAVAEPLKDREETEVKETSLQHTTSEVSVKDYFEQKMKEKLAKLGKTL